MEEKYLEELSDIRRIMERSSRFLSLSGLSGVAAGLCGLGGLYGAHRLLQDKEIPLYGVQAQADPELPLGALTGVALLTLVCALLSGLLFTYRKARRSGAPVWSSASRQMLIHLAIPLAAGGLFILGMIYREIYGFVVPACLVFYGLALVSASRYTLGEIRYLGLLDIALGIACLFFPAYSLYFCGTGFGLLHLVYGIAMWKKYDRS